jgi:hypothetical protein
MTWDFVHRWYMPFAWITVAWLVGVPLAIHSEMGLEMHTAAELGFAYGDGWVLRDDLLASLIPYLLGLGAAIWFFNPDGSTRWAAFWALGVACARIVAPVALATLSSVTTAGGQNYVDWHTLRYLLWFQDVQMLFLGVMVWGAFSRFVGSGSGASHSAYYAEA